MDFSRQIPGNVLFLVRDFQVCARRNQSNLHIVINPKIFKMWGPCLFWFLWLFYISFCSISRDLVRGGKKNTQQSAKILGEQEYAHQTHDKFAWGRAVIAFSENLQLTESKKSKKISSLKSSAYVGVGMCDMILPQVWLHCGASNLSLPLHPPLHPVFAWICFTLGRDGTLL